MVAGATLATCLTDVVELAALRGRRAALERIAAARGVPLPEFGRVTVGQGQLLICVRPERYLALTAAAAAGASVAAWQAACAGCAATVDLSSGLTMLVLAGARARELLTRGWRLDLDTRAFPAGYAAASTLAQVAVTVAALGSSLLILTPATYARHLREWLGGGARSIGLAVGPDVSIAALCGEPPR